MVDVCDKLCLVPVDLVVCGVRVLDNCRLVVVSPSAVGSVLFKSGGKIPTSLANVHFAALAGDSVDSWSALRFQSVLVGMEQVVDFQGGCVEDAYVLLLKDALNLVGRTA